MKGRASDNRESYRGKEDKTIIAFFPNKHERKMEEGPEIITLKEYGFHLIVLSDGDGYAVFENNQLVRDGGLAKLMGGTWLLRHSPMMI